MDLTVLVLKRFCKTVNSKMQKVSSTQSHHFLSVITLEKDIKGIKFLKVHFKTLKHFSDNWMFLGYVKIPLLRYRHEFIQT